MKKQIISALSAALLLAGCTSTNQSVVSEMKDGVYEGTAIGRNGEVKISLTIENQKVTDVSLIESEETIGIGTTAFEIVRDKLVEEQTLDIDTVTGATISGYAFKNAAKQCLEEAGADVDVWMNNGVKNPQDESIDTDVVVVGSGIAGVSAALTLAEGGKNVILVERNSVLGGSSARSDGMILAGGTKMQADNGIEDSEEAFFAEMKELHTESYIDEAMLKEYCYNADDALIFMEDNGVEFEYVWADHLLVERSHAAAGSGAQLMYTLEEKLKTYENVTIYTDTNVTSLLQDTDGAVNGAVAQKTDGSVLTFNADNVILCTGGFANNEEMSIEISGDLMAGHTTGSVGDGSGYVLAQSVGADMFNTFDSLAMDYYNVGEEYIGCWTYDLLFVQPDGKRHFSESLYVTDRTSELMKMGYGYEYAILDEEDYLIRQEDIDTGIQRNVAYKAESIEDAAEWMEVDASILQETIDRYNQLCADGEDIDLGKDGEYMNALEGDTYYILKMTIDVSETYSGPRLNENSQVIDQNGDPIQGLYAAGGISMWQVTDYHYSDCGTSMTNASVFGIIAANSILGE